jgi:predicted dehydrogenase
VNRQGRKIGVGVIGLGVGRAHVAAISHHSHAQIRFICDLDESRLKEARSLAPQAEATDRWRDVVLSSGIDLVVVATPDHLHAEMTEFAIRNSKHVFVEKPICIESDELTRLILALRENPLCLLSSNMVLRANPVLIDLRREMANKSLGMISHIEVGYLYGRFNKIASGWRGHSPRYSAILGVRYQELSCFRKSWTYS